MPTAVTYPGVYVEELPSGVRTITGVATSVTAFVGTAARGPVATATTITGFGDFERIFGGLDQRMPLGYAVRDFFANGGAVAIIVRLYVTPAGSAAEATFNVTNLPLEAASAGAWGNQVRVRIDRKPTDDPNLVAVAERLGVEPADIFDLTVRDGGTGTIESFLNLTTKESARRADRVLTAESGLVRVQTSLTLPDDDSPPAHDGELTDADVWTAAGKSTAATADSDDGRRRRQRRNSMPPTIRGVRRQDWTARTRAGRPVQSAVHPARQPHRRPARRRLLHRARLLRRPPSDADRRSRSGRGTAVVDPAGVAGLNLTGSRARNAAVYFPRLRCPTRSSKDRSRRSCRAGSSPASSRAPTPSAASGRRRPAPTRRSRACVGLAVELTDARERRAQPARASTACARSRSSARVVWGARTLRGADAAGRRVEVRPGPPHRALHRGEPATAALQVGGVRAERRAAVGADPPQRRRLHAQPVPPGRLPGHDAARGLLRQVRQGDDDPERHQPRHRQHPGRLRAAQAGRVRGHQAPADRRPDRRPRRRRSAMAQFTVNAQRFDPTRTSSSA